MEPSKAAMKAALRVLTALSKHEQPDQTDLDELHWYAPSDRERPVDELVCEAIQRALKDREQKRKAVKGQLRERALALTAAGHELATAPFDLPGQSGSDGEIERLMHEHSRRQEEYRTLTAKLKRLGIALQQASANAEAAKDVLQSVAGDVDISGITHLLVEHARLARRLLLDEEMLRRHAIK